MIALFRALWLYRNAVMIGAVVIGLLGTTGFFYLKGRADCKAAVKVKELTHIVNTREKLNEIRNHRPDTSGVVKRLRDGSF